MNRYDLYHDHNSRAIQDTISEKTKVIIDIKGIDVYYVPRIHLNVDEVLGEDIPSKFGSSYLMRMLFKDAGGFSNNGQLFTQYGVELRSRHNLIVHRGDWEAISTRNSKIQHRPMEGDLLFIKTRDKGMLLEILHVEDNSEDLYQAQASHVFEMECEVFEYDGNDMDTGILDVDNIESKHAYSYNLQLDTPTTEISRGDTIFQEMSDGSTIQGEVITYNDDTNTVEVINVVTDTTDFIEFVEGVITTGKGVSAVVVAIGDNITQLGGANDSIADDMDNFFIFDNNNPFGNPDLT